MFTSYLLTNQDGRCEFGWYLAVNLKTICLDLVSDSDCSWRPDYRDTDRLEDAVVLRRRSFYGETLSLDYQNIITVIRLNHLT